MARIRQDYVIGAEDRTARAVASAKRSFLTLDRTVRRALGGLAAFAGIGGMGVMIKQTITAADKIQKLSIRLGASTEALSQYQHVAQQSGLSFQTLTTALQRMVRRSAEAAQGSGPLADALKELGIDAQAFAKLKPSEQFETLADAFEEVGSSGERVRLAMKVFDTEGVAMLQAMKGGSKAIRLMRDEADLLGLTIGQKTADQAAAFNDSIGRLKSALQGLTVDLVETHIEAIVKFAQTLSYLVPLAVHDVRVGFNAIRTVWYDFFASWREIDATIWETLDNLTGNTIERFGKEYRLAMEDVIKFSERASLAAYDTTEAIENRLKFMDKWLALIRRRVALPTSQDYAASGASGETEIEKAYDTIKISAEATENITQRVGNSMANSFTDAITQARTFNDALKDLARSLIHLAAQKAIADQVASGLSTILGAAFNAGSTASIYRTNPGSQQSAMLAAQDVGLRAGGGPVSAGRPYIVGEAGPEIFVPRASGSVLPNGSAPGLNQTITINANGADASMIPRLKQAVAEAAHAGYAMVMNDLQRGGPIRRMI